MARLFFKLLRGIVCVEDRRACFLVHMPGDDLPPFGRVFGRHDIFARHHDAALSAHGLLALGANQVELSGAQGENVLGEFKRAGNGNSPSAAHCARLHSSGKRAISWSRRAVGAGSGIQLELGASHRRPTTQTGRTWHAAGRRR